MVLSTHLSLPTPQATLYLSLLNTYIFKDYLKLGSCLHRPCRETCLGKSYSSSVAFLWPSACHIWLHFCVPVTFRILKNHELLCRGWDNKQAWILVPFYDLTPDHHYTQRGYTLKTENQPQFPFFFWCLLKTKHADCDIFFFALIWADGSETALDIMVFLRCIQIPATCIFPKRKRKMRSLQLRCLWISAHLKDLSGSHSTVICGCLPGGLQAGLLSEICPVTMPPLMFWQKLISFTGISSKPDWKIMRANELWRI